MVELEEQKSPVKIEQNGPESCSLPLGGGFVLVRVPLQVTMNGSEGVLAGHYQIRGFVGREVPLLLNENSETMLTARIPAELFKEGELLTLRVTYPVNTGRQRTIFSKCFEITSSDDGVPRLEAVSQ